MRCLLALPLLVLCLACGPDPAKVETIGISGPTRLVPGEDASYEAAAYNGLSATVPGKSFTWASSDPSIAYVSEQSGSLLAKRPGTVEVTASVDGKSGLLSVTIDPPTRPLARTDARLVYNPVLQRVMLFGGLSQAQSMGDLWSWDGTAWRLVSLNGPRRQAPAIAWDSSRNRLVVYGGNETQDDGTRLSAADTWEWDGSAWKQVGTAGPPARRQMTGGFDVTSGTTVIYGGFDDANADVALYDTWAWNGTAWTQKATTSPASGGYELPALSAVYSAAHSGLYVLVHATLSQNASRLMRWSGADWTDVGAGPEVNAPAPLAVDGAGDLLILDEASVTTGVSKAELYRWSGTSPPPKLAPASAPPDRFGSAMAHDPSRGKTVLFGGVAVPNRLADTWTFDGSTWTQAQQ